MFLPTKEGLDIVIKSVLDGKNLYVWENNTEGWLTVNEGDGTKAEERFIL